MPEQVRIAEFFTTLDAKLDWLVREVRGWRQYKQGLMQALFTQELRFLDDRGQAYPDWEEKTLGNLARITMGQSPPSTAYNSEGIGLPLIQGNADRKGRSSLPRNYTSVTTRTCSIGDVLMSVRAPAGTVFWSNHEACIGRGVCSIRSKDEHAVLTEYLFHYLVKEEETWSEIAQGSTFLSLTGDHVKTLPLPLPSLPEQRKIADLLSAVDGKIGTLDNQVRLWELQKQGLMQRMFV